MHTHTHGLVSPGRTYTMSCDQSYPFPQVFVVDRGGGQQHPAQPPDLVPCWSFPPAQKRAKNRSYSYMGAVPGVSLVVLFLFLLVFAAMGVGAYQIYNMQKELRQMREVRGREHVDSCSSRLE